MAVEGADVELEEAYNALVRVCGMPERYALPMLDALIVGWREKGDSWLASGAEVNGEGRDDHSLRSIVEFGVVDATRTLKNFRMELERAKEELRGRGTWDFPCDDWLETLRQNGLKLGEDWGPKAIARYGDQRDELRDAALRELVVLEEDHYDAVLETLRTKPIVSKASVNSVIEGCSRLEGVLRKRKLLTEVRSAGLRRARERAAWVAPARKLAEAEVVAGGGGQRKAERLQLEAQELLRQSWSRLFPGEAVPSSAIAPQLAELD